MVRSLWEQGSGNQFSRNAKLDEATLIRIAFCFSRGASIKAASDSTGLSTKTVRSLYLEFRRRLGKAKFNRWHTVHQRLLAIPFPEQELLVRTTFLDVLADCYFNRTCYRNFQLGNRKARLCRACLLLTRFTEPARVEEALGIIDGIHAFYDRLGIRGEAGEDQVALFRLRLIHTATVATALANSKTASGGLASPKNPGFLSIWTLLDSLLTDLAEQPL